MWRPKRCAVHEWDARVFCERAMPADGSGMLLIGDSLMQQAAAALMNVLAIARANCSARVRYASSDTLVKRNFGRNNRGAHWLDHVRRELPGIAVLSAGAHLRAHPGASMLEVLQDVQRAAGSAGLPPDLAARYREHNRSLRVLWKTQQYGGCAGRALAPALRRGGRSGKELCVNITRNMSSVHYLAGGYNWDWFERFDDAALRLLPPAGVVPIDLRMNRLRPDAHVSTTNDCLHSCLKSGVLSSTFPRMLQHVLLMQAAHTDTPTMIEATTTDSTE